MHSEKEITKDEIKLDSVLSLVLLAQQNHRNMVSLFHERYSALFLGELERLENILFEDGLIQYSVGDEGLEIGMSKEGLTFISYGGYSSDFSKLAFPNPVKKNWRLAPWHTNLMIVGIFLVTIIFFILFHKKFL